jgi:hypothetical protein
MKHSPVLSIACTNVLPDCSVTLTSAMSCAMSSCRCQPSLPWQTVQRDFEPRSLRHVMPFISWRIPYMRDMDYRRCSSPSIGTTMEQCVCACLSTYASGRQSYRLRHFPSLLVYPPLIAAPLVVVCCLLCAFVCLRLSSPVAPVGLTSIARGQLLVPSPSVCWS